MLYLQPLGWMLPTPQFSFKGQQSCCIEESWIGPVISLQADSVLHSTLLCSYSISLILHTFVWFLCPSGLTSWCSPSPALPIQAACWEWNPADFWHCVGGHFDPREDPEASTALEVKDTGQTLLSPYLHERCLCSWIKIGNWNCEIVISMFFHEALPKTPQCYIATAGGRRWTVCLHFRWLAVCTCCGLQDWASLKEQPSLHNATCCNYLGPQRQRLNKNGQEIKCMQTHLYVLNMSLNAQFLPRSQKTSLLIIHILVIKMFLGCLPMLPPCKVRWLGFLPTSPSYNR